jgi:hypothetical protein
MRLRHTILVLVVPCAALGAYQLGSRFGHFLRPDATSNEEADYHIIDGLAVRNADLNLGEIWEQRDFYHELPIENRNGFPVKVLDFERSCGCVAVEPQSLTLAPGETKAVRLRLDLANRTRLEIGRQARDLAIEVRPITVRTDRKQAPWLLQGAVKSRVTLNRLALEFGESPIHGASPCLRHIDLKVHVPGGSPVLTFDHRIITAELKSVGTDAATYERVAAPLPSLEPGPFESSLDIDVITPDGSRHEGIRVPISGIMQPEVRILPARLFLGSVRLGESAESTVTLQAPNGTAPTLDHIECETEDVQAEAQAATGDLAGRVYRIRITKAKEGRQTRRLSFWVRERGENPARVMIEVAYIGTANRFVSEGTQE